MPNEMPPIPKNAVETHTRTTDDINRLSSFEQVRSPLLPPPGIDTQSVKSRKNQRWRYLLGLALLAFTVVLWTASNFLASTLFADDTYSKPYLVTYINTSFFVLPLFPLAIRQAITDPSSFGAFFRSLRRSVHNYRSIPQDVDDDDDTYTKPASPLLTHNPQMTSSMELERVPSSASTQPEPPLNLLSTASLSCEFCILWFLANYFVAACLSYTTVASSTILTSTSSVFTLLFGIAFRVESYSLTKSLGVAASLAGIVLISTVDLSGQGNDSRGTFPHKEVWEIAAGDAMALFSALLYGLYAVFMKKRIGDESRVDMPLFFGLVGLFNVLLLWPGFIILHFTGVEQWEAPPSGRVVGIILMNSCSSFISDYAWAYAILLTSPIVVTVGLSMTIPLSLIGQIVLNDQRVSGMYWLGACVVVGSFVIVNYESKEPEGEIDEVDGDRNVV